MTRPPQREMLPLLDMGPGGCWLNLVADDEGERLQRYTEMQRTLKQHQQAAALIDYRLKLQPTTDVSEKESVEDEDALQLMSVVCGGYVEDDFGSYLSYNDFQQKKEEFGVLRSVYQSIQKKYHNKKVEEAALKFRSVLLMVYLEENIPKMSRGRVEELFSRNMIVW